MTYTNKKKACPIALTHSKTYTIFCSTSSLKMLVRILSSTNRTQQAV